MKQQPTSMSEFLTDARGALILEEARTPPEIAAAMVKNTQLPGHLRMPPTTDLVISQVLLQPFHVTCDLGKGRFSRHATPLDFVVIAPGVAAHGHMAATAHLRSLGIPADLARACLELDPDEPLEFGPLHTDLQRDPLIAHALETLWQELGRRDPAARLFSDSIVAAIVIRLARLGASRTQAQQHRGGLAPQQSARVIDHMQAHLDRPVTLRELAALAGLSPWHFARAFHQSHGAPPHRYLTRLRIQRAQELLRHSNLPVGRIAIAVGYSPQQLARHFRAATGVAPSEYRRGC